MKHILITIIAAMILVGCGESQQSAPAPESKPVEPVAEASQPEPSTAEAPDYDIWVSARLGNIEAVRWHLDAGTDVNAKGVTGWTALHHAALNGGKEIVELLIGKGADVNAKNNLHKTPLYYAERETIDLLRKHGGKRGYELKAEATQPEPTTAKAPDISIHKAAEDGNIEAVKQYLDGGADVNAKDKLGWTPMFYAASSGRKEIAELLIAKGADVNAKSKFGSQIPLYFAAQSGYREIAELLIENGADVNAKIDRGRTPLYAATYGGYNQVIELLIAKGADVNAKSDDGRTSLDYAEKLEDWRSPEDRAAKKETADLLRKHGGKTGEELKAEGK